MTALEIKCMFRLSWQKCWSTPNVWRERIACSLSTKVSMFQGKFWLQGQKGLNLFRFTEKFCGSYGVTAPFCRLLEGLGCIFFPLSLNAKWKKHGSGSVHGRGLSLEKTAVSREEIQQWKRLLFLPQTNRPSATSFVITRTRTKSHDEVFLGTSTRGI